MLGRVPVLLLVVLLAGLSGCDATGGPAGEPVQVTGRVVNASRDGAPLAGLDVKLWASTHRYPDDPTMVLLGSTTTDADGAFAFDAVAPAETSGQLDLTVNVRTLAGDALATCGRRHAETGCTEDPRYPGAVVGVGRAELPAARTVPLYEYAPLVLRAVPAQPPPPPDAYLLMEGGWYPTAVFGTYSDAFYAAERDSVVFKARGGRMNPVYVRVSAGGTVLAEVRDSVYCPVGETTRFTVPY